MILSKLKNEDEGSDHLGILRLKLRVINRPICSQVIDFPQLFSIDLRAVFR